MTSYIKSLPNCGKIPWAFLDQSKEYLSETSKVIPHLLRKHFTYLQYHSEQIRLKVGHLDYAYCLKKLDILGSIHT